MKVFPQGPPPGDDNGAVFVGQANTSILNAAARLLELMAHPGDAEPLAPLIMDEILLARLANMSLSSFHVHFKSVTAVSPFAVPESAAPPGGQTSHVVPDGGCRDCESAHGVHQRFAVQQRVRPLFRKLANQGHHQAARTRGRRRR